MISSYNITTQNVAVDGLLTFTTDRILTGCTVTRNGPIFQLNKPGYYYVTFNADGAATTAVGDIVVVLQNNGVAVPGAIAPFTTTVADDATNLAFSTLVQVRPSCPSIDNAVRLTFVNEGVDATYNMYNVVVTKIC